MAYELLSQSKNLNRQAGPNNKREGEGGGDKIFWKKKEAERRLFGTREDLNDKTRSFTFFKYVCMYVCMYLFAIDKKSLKIVYSLILQSIKLSN